MSFRSSLSLIILTFAALFPRAVSAQGWPEIFDPFQLRTINLTISTGDWNTIRFDQTFAIEVPAQLALGAESPIWVAVRRKSGDGLPSEADPQKISLKIDINEIVPGQTWHGLKKVSLENGDDSNVVTEGFSWYMHRLAEYPDGYLYKPGMAAWVKLYVNGQYKGVYTNVEQVDKRFLENRGIFVNGSTWLYKSQGPTSWELREGAAHSPTYNTLCYEPFPEQTCATPDPTTMAATLPGLIEMQGMLTLGAVNAFTFSPDNLFSKGKNFFWADFSTSLSTFLPWDLDTNLSRFLVTPSIYDRGNSSYEDLIIDNPTFRTQYNNVMRNLILGPCHPDSLVTALNTFETLLTTCLASDPNSQIGNVADFFDDFRDWVPDRQANVLSQLPAVTGVPNGYRPGLGQILATPNPFRSATTINFEAEEEGLANMDVFDIAGRRVGGYTGLAVREGLNEIPWKGTHDSGARLSPGIYFIRVSSGKLLKTGRVTVLP